MIICSTLSTQSDALDVGVVLTDKPNAPIRFEKVVDCILCGYVGTEVLFEMSFHYGQVNIPYPGLIFIINMYNSCLMFCVVICPSMRVVCRRLRW